MIGLAVNYISQQLFGQPNSSNISDVEQNRSSAIGMGVSATINNIIPGANGILKGILAGSVSGGLSGGLVAGIEASLSGSNFGNAFWAGFKSGAITGGAMGGVTGYFTARTKNLNVWTGTPKRNDYLRLASYFQPGLDYDEIPINPANGMGQRIVDIAEDYLGSTDYNLLSKKDDFYPGNPKCNKFVYDVLTEAGAGPGLPNQPGRWGGPGPKPPIASQWGNPNYRIPGWEVVSGAPSPGDVASFGGHVGIVFGNRLTISATLHNGVVKNNWGFRPMQTPVFRRFVGYQTFNL